MPMMQQQQKQRHKRQQQQEPPATIHCSLSMNVGVAAAGPIAEGVRHAAAAAAEEEAATAAAAASAAVTVMHWSVVDICGARSWG
ncbi:uncharacterized protein LOC117581051 [Drosophila guanche]|uniref:uncharacterized protein LOC117581051 n=1 Tax=Drosophila guanche TaxID=7266 RepID=UPI0014722520|nr:uncharacterized protein LOC117581051 [Drosophila guanche]